MSDLTDAEIEAYDRRIMTAVAGVMADLYSDEELSLKARSKIHMRALRAGVDEARKIDSELEALVSGQVDENGEEKRAPWYWPRIGQCVVACIGLKIMLSADDKQLFLELAPKHGPDYVFNDDIQALFITSQICRATSDINMLFENETALENDRWCDEGAKILDMVDDCYD